MHGFFRSTFCLVVLASVAEAAPIRASGPTFEHVVIDPSPPPFPHCKAVGDIDGDGLPDVVLGTAVDGSGLFWYSNPDWVRTTIVPPGIGFTTDSELADVDGDGDLDLVIPKGVHIGQSVWWYENPRPDGDPASDPWREHEVGPAGAHDVSIDDIDGDGRRDILARFGSTVLFLQEAPDTWRRVEIQPPVFGNKDEGMEIGDVDGDGDTDVVVGGFWFENPRPDATADRTWARHEIEADWPSDARITVGDLDQDGRLDVILGPSESPDGRLSWFRADDPRGAWTEHELALEAEYIHALEVADIDLDGDPDVVSAEMHQSSDPDDVIVWLNDGTGLSFSPLVIATTGSHNISVVDMDRDGDFDIVGANWDGSGPLEMWRNETRGRPRLDRWQRYLIDGDMPWQPLFVRWGDIDHDGWVDIVTGGWWYRNPGTVGGADWTRHEIGDPLGNVLVVHDFDGDGDLDLFGTTGKPSSSLLAWAENDGAGSFSPAGIGVGAGPFPQGVTTADFTADGTFEIAISWQNGEEGRSGVQRVIAPRDPRDGNWPIDILAEVSQGEGLTNGDIDGDGDLDIFQGSLWLRNDGGTFTQFVAAEFDERLGGPDRNRLADVDGDGDLDAVVGFSHFPGPDTDLIWLEPPDDPASGLWTIHTIATEVWGGFSLDVVDLDRDGDLDVILGEHRGQTRALIYENEGDGNSWIEHVVDPGGPEIDHHVGTRAVDLDGDGDLDIVSIGWDNDKLWIFENLSPLPGTSSSSMAPYIRSDANADGIVDLSDALFVLIYLFREDTEAPCLAAADFDASGEITLTDAIADLDFLFRGGATPPAPYPDCGTAPGDEAIGCESYAACE